MFADSENSIHVKPSNRIDVGTLMIDPHSFLFFTVRCAWNIRILFLENNE